MAFLIALLVAFCISVFVIEAIGFYISVRAKRSRFAISCFIVMVVSAWGVIGGLMAL